MINSYLVQQIKGNFLYKPTLEQEKAVKFLADFLFSRQSDSVFLLKGYAGTGKTSLIGALVKTLDQLQQKCVLLAPTGRAAKVFSHYAQHPAYTIHKKIYRQRNFSNDLDNFSLDDNLHQHTLFIVDEASMIANDGLAGAVFGTGRLLDDLIQYVYAGTGCRLMLIGDTAQLPPVGEEESPALSADKLRGYGMEVYEAQLTEVVRQMHDSGILWNATELRRYISEENFLTLPSVRVEGFPDIRMVSGSELIEVYNKGIRNTILFREDELNSGDLLMVAKNNYFWTEGCKEIDFIANGDIAVVRRVRRVREAYGFRFADVVLAFPDYDGMELEVKLLLDTLHTETPALPKELNDKLFYSVLEDYADITVKRERMKKMKADPHYNALQVKYAYAVTCHKAQGGQWKRVFLDQGYMTENMLTPDYFRWLYTAFTRATEILYLVNWPKEQTE